MARIGFKKAKYNKIVNGKYEALKENKVPEFEKVVDEKFAPEYNNAELYANDGLAETDYSFKKGALSVTVADDDDDFIAGLFGNAIAENGEVVSTINDTAPECGYGHIVPKIVGGARKFKAEFFPRVKWTKISTDNKTRGESVEFGTTALEGIVMPVDTVINGIESGVWEKHQTFNTLAEAETYLDGLLTPEA